MPYRNVRDLPNSVQFNLPDHAQEIYKQAFNSAWEHFQELEDRRGDYTREEKAHIAAWTAVKSQY
ncbi:MAG: ChaB family protein [Anaerolineae bacterium]|nr:ChaB family protein [Anaerolineae bacterium]